VTGATGIRGPLVFVEHVRRVALGEQVEIALEGRRWQAQVIDAGEQHTALQLLEEGLGLVPARPARIQGDVAKSVVGREPSDGSSAGSGRPRRTAPPVGEALRLLNGAPLNPARGCRPRS
jgi:vacuolar-type H+-ATPase subunit B/Vma2